MKKSIFNYALVLLMFAVFVPVHSVNAQSSSSQSWTSAIVYFNTSTDSGSMTVDFYDGTTTYSSGAIALTGHQNGTLLVGSVSSLPSSFKGSAVLSAGVPIAVTYYDFVEGADANNYDRSYYVGFKPSQANAVIYVPTVERAAFGPQLTSRVGIQNIDPSDDATIRLDFYNVGSTTPFFSPTETVQEQASYIFSMDDYSANISAGFSGSLIVTSTGGEEIVAAAEETADIKRYAYAFEGVAGGESLVYVPTMLCRYGGKSQISYYAIQAVGGTAEVTVKHYDKVTGSQLGTTYTTSIAVGSKEGVNPCQHGVSDGAVGSSIITSTGADVIVIVKVNGNTGLRTAYIAEGSGATNVALPYVRWSNDVTADFRTYIAVMNVSPSTATDVKAEYYNPAGTLITTHIIADGGSPLLPLQKGSTWTELAGMGSGDWEGSVIIKSDQDVLVTIRATRTTTGLETDAGQFGEDYVGIPIP